MNKFNNYNKKDGPHQKSKTFSIEIVFMDNTHLPNKVLFLYNNHLNRNIRHSRDLILDMEDILDHIY